MPSPRNFTCECGGRYNTFRGLRQHQVRYCRATSTDNENLMYSCVCGSRFNTSQGLSQHQSRYCRGISVDNPNLCSICEKNFNTYAGYRQHLKRTHPVEYNAELLMEANKPDRLWTTDEINDLSKAEAEFEGSDLMTFLQSISNRSLNAIKARRKLIAYKDRVAHFKRELLNNRLRIDSENSETNTQRIHSELTARLRDHIIDLNQLSDSSSQLRYLLLNCPADEAKEKLDEWCNHLVEKYGRRADNAGNRNQLIRTVQNIRRQINDQTISSRKRRALRYRLAQIQYKNNRKVYANELLDGLTVSTDNSRPNSKDIRSAYDMIFGSPSIEDSEDIKLPSNVYEISTPISTDDIVSSLKLMRNGAPGPDGISLAKLRSIPTSDLCILFNAILYLEFFPSVFRCSRTSLIQKTSSDLHLVNNWRPITISSFIYRLFAKILTRRVEIIPLHESQRGFTKIDGCFANNSILENLIKHRRRKGQPLSIVSLDLRKAFDSVSHFSIVRALRRLGVDPKFINVIADSYKNASTNIFCGPSHIGSFNVKKGVKQGDPLSPFLFNAVLDELLELLSNRTGIPTGPDSNISCLAYADDLILVAASIEDATRLLEISTTFFAKRGLAVNPGKCKAIILKSVPSKKKLCVVSEPMFKVDDTYIPQLNISETFRYLGQKFSVEGTSPCDAHTLSNQIGALLKAPLKPQQKLDILRTFLVPRYIHSLQRPNITQKILRNVDVQIRSAAKKILHLPSHCHNSIFYTPTKCGGLGLFNFSRMIPVISLSRWSKLEDSSDNLRNALRLRTNWRDRFASMAQGFTSTKDIRELFSQQLEYSWSGNGISQVKNHPACSDIFRNSPRFWSSEEFILALHLRLNFLPTRALPYNSAQDRRCRANGCFKVESLSHVLQGCAAVHWERVSRHNYVLKRLADAARKKQWEVKIEPNIRGSDGRLYKPDALFIKGQKVIVSDVGIHWEGRIPLSSQFENKAAIYSVQPFLDELTKRYADKEIYIIPLIIGARGAWCLKNNYLVNLLGLDRKDVSDLITTTMRGGWMIHKQFMRRVWQSE